MKRVFKNPWLYIFIFVFIYAISLLTAAVLLMEKNKSILKKQATETNANKIKQKLNEKILNGNIYFSTDYFVNINDEEKATTTAGIICVLGNGNVLHTTMTAENIDGRIKETEETVNFLIKHWDKILDDLIKTIVEAGQRSPVPESKPEKEKTIKKKV